MSDTQIKYEHCRHCGKPVSIKWELADTLGTASRPATDQLWDCPHGCGFLDRSLLRGRILAVWVGHSTERPQ